jgi:hypothetical protein
MRVTSILSWAAYGRRELYSGLILAANITLTSPEMD